jgi:hypothetical protein
MFLKTQKLLKDEITDGFVLVSFWFESTQIESLTPYIGEDDIEYTCIGFKSGDEVIVDNDIEELVAMLHVGVPFSIN